MKKNFLKKALLCFSLALGLSLVAVAQDPGGGGGLGDTDAPIDGGVSLLIAAGVGYGVKKYRDGKKKKEE